MKEKQREQWSSRAGFVLAAAGSAVGLGNLWKFPYIVGKNGGGAFMIIYVIMLFSIGLCVVLGEIAIGRATQKNVFGAYRKIDKRFSWLGVLGLIAVFLVICFYSTIGGWVIKYLAASITTGIGAEAKQYFDTFKVSPVQTAVCQILFIIATAVIVGMGVQKGIEKASKIMMPMLFVILIILCIRSLTLSNAGEGVKFLLKPDFSKLSVNTVIAALGQAFFSLSAGIGTLITYGSYLSRDEHIKKTAIYIPLLDTAIAILAGLAIMPAVFSFGLEPNAGPELTFITLPIIFEHMMFGRFFEILFFILLFFAAITSSISMFENILAFLSEELHMPRVRAAVILCFVISAASLPCAFSTNILADFKLFGKTVFDFFDFTASNVLMPLCGVLMCIFIGYVWKTKNAVYEITNHGRLPFRLAGVWSALIRYVAPAVIFIVLLFSIGVI